VDVRVFTVSVLAPLLSVAGLNCAVAPGGRPVIVRLAALLKPFCGVIVAVHVALPPAVAVCDEGLAEMLNVGWTVTLRVRGRILVTAPLAATRFKE
jgi:hypothetical protein